MKLNVLAVAVVTAFAMGSANAALPDSWTVGGALGWAHMYDHKFPKSVTEDNVDVAMDWGRNGYGIKLFGEYNFTDWFGLGLGYNYIGGQDGYLKGTVAGESFKDGSKMHFNIAELYGKFGYTFDDNGSDVFFKAGPTYNWGSWAGEKEGYPDETAWQPNKATQTTFDGVKEAGFTSVRIPISWLKMIGPEPSYTIDKAWMDRVYEVVGFAHAAGLNVIINTHHDENHGVSNGYQWLDIKNAANNPSLNESIKAKIKAVWTQIAERFADCGDWLIMEGFNELNDGGWGWSEDFRKDPTRQCGILNEWNQVFVDAVRATGGENATRWLGVPTYAANPEYAKYLKMPSDKAGRLMLSVHFYDPSPYTIGDEQYSDWGHTGAKGKKADYGDEDHVQEVFGMLNKEYVSKNIPCYLGEFGCSMRAKSDTRAWRFYLYYMEYIVKADKTFGLPCFLWDNGATDTGKEQHGYINHGTGGYIGNSKEVVNILKKAWFTESDGYTLQHVYDSAPKF